MKTAEKKIIVTGGAGFIGSHLVQKLLKNAWNVVVLDDFNDYYNPAYKRENIAPFLNHPHFTLKEGNICDKKWVTEVFESFQPTHVVHLAARAGVRPSLLQPELYTDVNITGTLHVLEAVKKLSLENFIFASSSSVYGNTKEIPFVETDPVETQLSPYALTKRAGEFICEIYSKQYGIPITALRFFTVYGPRQRPDLAIRRFMESILEKKPIQMFGKGDTSRDYTYIDDIVDGVYKSIQSPRPFEIINLGNSHPITLKKLILRIEKTLGKKAIIQKKPYQKGDMVHTYADITKAKKLLKWEPATSLEEGIEKTAKWVLKRYKL